MLKRYFIPLVLLLVLAAIGAYLFGNSHPRKHDVRAAVPVERFTLANGLTVVVMPNERLPVVTHMLIVKAGSSDDPYGKSGLAHYLEHLMFTGTKNYPEGVYDRSIARVGGAQNAFTTRDFTLFYATVAKENLGMVMTMEADRLGNLAFEPTRAARELKIITEERNMRVDNSPVAQWEEQLDALLFLNHPYHQPVIGWLEDMQTFTAADAREFFAAHYRASNMILLVAGDVTPRDVRRFAQKYYGNLAGGGVTPRDWPKEPPSRMARHGDMKDSRVNEARLQREYLAPSAVYGNTKEAMPLSVFAYYLGGGDTSVLYTTLVREQKLATDISAGYDPLSIGPATLRINAIPAAGVTPQQLEQALDAELAKVVAGPLDTAAITRSKTLITAEIIYAQDGLQQMANIMAELYAKGLDEQFFYNWSDNIAKVTDADALAAARDVIKPPASVTGYLLPDAKPLTSPIPPDPAAATPAATEAPNAK